MAVINPFHLAIPVRDIDEAKSFYGDKLGFAEGRSSDHWVDYNMFGHQLVVHLDEKLKVADIETSSLVDGHRVPVPHFGVIMSIPDWKAFAERIEAIIERFIVKPYVRFEGQTGEQCTMFFADPSGNALEFKAFHDIETQLFAK